MPAPSIPGTRIGEYQNGYFWNGTSWDEGETAGTPAAPSVAATPAPASSVSTSPSKRPSILSTIMRIESGGRNVAQQIDDINMRRGDPAQGFYQITGGTWRDFGGDKTGQKSAIDAPYGAQLQIAQNIPVERWGPATQEALKRAGYEHKPGETLGQMLARYNENPAATRPEDVGGSSDGGGAAVAAAPAQPNTGLLQAQIDKMIADQATRSAEQTAATEAAKQAKEQEAAYAGLTKEGMGLLEKAQTKPAQFMQMDGGGGVNLPDPKNAPPLPNYVQEATAPDFMTMLMQQRLQRRT